MLLLWLLLFKAETEEELEKIKEMEVPIMSRRLMLIIRLQLHQNSARKKGSVQKQGMMRHRHCIMPEKNIAKTS